MESVLAWQQSPQHFSLLIFSQADTAHNAGKAVRTQVMHANTGAPARADTAAQRKASCEDAGHACKHKFACLGTFCS